MPVLDIHEIDKASSALYYRGRNSLIPTKMEVRMTTAHRNKQVSSEFIPLPVTTAPPVVSAVHFYAVKSCFRHDF